MTPMVQAHADRYPPSSAARFIACPGSVDAMPLYPREESEHSDKGDLAHNLLETALLFGIRPNASDPDMNENIELVLDWVAERRAEYGPECIVYAEQRLDIPQTGEFGTSDIIIVAPFMLHIADYKNGYVPVEIHGCEQLLMYLLGAIAKYGTRPHYRITICQPNYNHRDGPIRTIDVSHQEIAEYALKVEYAVISRYFAAGKHCKKTYCPHRGNCRTFLEWAQTNAADAWFPSDVNALSNDQLSSALDHTDILQGIRDELRKEAMRRILQQDAKIHGYKVVKGRKDRQFVEDGAAVVRDTCLQLGATDDDLFEKKFTSVAGVERFIKRISISQGRGAWKENYARLIAPHVNEYQAGLALERAIDGRPSHRRGSEFGPLLEAPQQRTIL